GGIVGVAGIVGVMSGGVSVRTGRMVAVGVESGVPVRAGSVAGVSSGRGVTTCVATAASSTGACGVQPISTTAMNKTISHSITQARRGDIDNSSVSRKHPKLRANGLLETQLTRTGSRQSSTTDLG